MGIELKKWVVSLNVENFYLKSNDSADVERMGFYATRCIEAHDSREAEMKAISLIKQEYWELCANTIDNPPVINMENAKEVQSFGENAAPGKGGSFYSDPL